MAWSWQSIKEGALAVLDGPMKKLETELKLSAKTFPVHHRTATTDGSAATLATIPIPVDHTVYITYRVVARRTGGVAGSANDGAAYRLEVVAKNTAGTAAEIAAETLYVIGESQAGWTITTSASSGSILIQVTGAADNNISWRGSVQTFSVKNED